MLLTVVLLAGALVAAVTPAPARAAAPVPIPGAGTTHPRVLLWPEQLEAVRDRVTREPLTTLLASVRRDAEAAPPANPADQVGCNTSANEVREVAKAGAARTLGFVYLLDREVVGGAVRPLDPVDRGALGDRVRDLLLHMCTHSRIRVNPDRDLGSSHELLGYATAYDLLLGGDYPFADGDRARIEENLANLASELTADYQTPIGGFLTNNHGFKGASSLGIAALVLADYEPPVGSEDSRRPRRWLDHALETTDEVMRYSYGPGDGAYGESPHYLKYGMQNGFSFLRAWHRANGGGGWTTEPGVAVPDLWSHPSFQRMARWLLDHTLPDGSLAPIDDGNGGESAFWGAYPPDVPGASALYWRWLTLDTQDYGGSVDNRLDTIVAFDDAVPPAPPPGSPTAFYEEGGSAVLRSGWEPDATLAIVQGEHGAARELGRDRTGVGQEWSAPHDHADPGAVQFHAEGEPLLLDGGYVNYPWTLQWVVNKPSDHNMVLVSPPSTDGLAESPMDPLTESTRPLWDPAHAQPFFSEPWAASPVDGDAQLFDTLDSAFVDTASVVASYGTPAARVARRTALVDDRILVVADTATSPTTRTWTWPLHGNAGGTEGTWPGAPAKPVAERRPSGAAALGPSPLAAAGGTFTETAAGGVWQRPSGVSLAAGLAFDAGDRTTVAVPSLHEQGYKVLTQHTALQTSVTAAEVRGVQVLVPTAAGQPAAQVTELDVAGTAALRVDDPGSGARVLAVHRRGGGRLVVPGSLSGLPDVSTDADLLVVTGSASGQVRSVWASGATEVVLDGARAIRVDVPGDLGLRFRPFAVDVVAATADPTVDVPIGVGSVSGACALAAISGGGQVTRARDPRFTVTTTAGAGAPAADPGRSRRVEVGRTVLLDASGSCDPDGGPLTSRWELVSAPPGSAWALSGSASPVASLLPDVPGVYRVELVVTDATGRPSEPTELVLLAGSTTRDSVDGDLDGRFDAADPDLDTGDLRFVPVTPTRVLDTRAGLGAAAGTVAGGDVRTVAVAGRVVPDDAVAVAGTATLVGPNEATHLTVWPSGTARPPTSTVNAAAGATVANHLVSEIGIDGALTVGNRAGAAHVVVDVTGYWLHRPEAGGLTASVPRRVLDTRADGTPWAAGEVRGVAVTGAGSGVPAEAAAVVLNVTAVAPSADTHLTVWPRGRPRPVASSLNAPAGSTVAALVTVPVGPGGVVDLRNQAGGTHVVVDVVGWYGNGPGVGGSLVPVAPTRLLDTRQSGETPLGPGEARVLAVAGGAVPEDATAVLLNLTAVAPDAATHLTAWPSGVDRPNASSLNVARGATVANAALVGVGAGGTVTVRNQSGSVDLVVDLVGWVRPA